MSSFPFYWMVVLATNAMENIIKFRPALTPVGELVVNLGKVFDAISAFQMRCTTNLLEASRLDGFGFFRQHRPLVVWPTRTRPTARTTRTTPC